MPVLFPHLYVVRPRPALEELSREVSPLPWFAAPSVWMTMAVGDHDHEGQLGHSEQLLRLHFLAALHREASASIASWPLTIETFERFWELVPAGHFVHEASAEHARLVDLRAVVPPTEPITPAGRGALLWKPGTSLATWWQEMIAGRIESDEMLVAAVLWAAERLRQRFPDEVPDRRCGAYAARDVTMQTLEAALDRSDWTRDLRAPLQLRLVSRQFDEIELAFEIVPEGAKVPLHEGQVRATMAADAGAWKVAEGALVLVTRTEQRLT